MGQDNAGVRYAIDPVLDWNDVALEAALIDSKRQEVIRDSGGTVWVNRDQGGVTRTARAMAMVQAALYNAVVGIEGRYRPYLIDLPPVPGPGNRDLAAAVAGAGLNILRLLYPRQRRVTVRQADGSHLVFDRGAHFEQAFLDTQRRAEQNPQILPSVTFGHNVAVRVFNARANDGAQDRRPYDRHDVPGVWRPDVLDPVQIPLDPHWGRVRPFLLDDGDMDAVFRSVPPPPGYRGRDAFDLDDPQYRAERRQVIDVGNNLSDAQRRNAAFWSYDEGRGTPVRLYNHAVRAVLLRQDLRGKFDAVEHARILLYANLVMADATIAAWRLKYEYRTWRPVHAARLDPKHPLPAWTPFGKRPPYAPVNGCSPPFPAYVSGHSTLGRAVFDALARFVAPGSPFALTSEELPREAVVYPSLTAAADAIDASRVQLGVHFPADVTAGSGAGAELERRAYGRLPGPAPKGPQSPEADVKALPFEVRDFRKDIPAEAGDIPGYGDEISRSADGPELKEV